MLSRRATLVQDIRELILAVRPTLTPLLETHAHYGLGEEDVLQWILSEEIELIYGLFDQTHFSRRSDSRYQHIYQEFRSQLPWSLSVVVSHFIRAPSLFDENIVDLRLTPQDLYIGFHRDDFDTAPLPLRLV